MKRTLMFISALAILLGNIVLSGCSTWYGGRDPNHSFRFEFRTYEHTRPLKLLAHRHQGMYYDIGFADPADPKDPFKLRSTETSFKIQVGHPKKFVGKVLSVDVWLDDRGPIRATQHKDGHFYFKVYTGARWLHGIGEPSHSGLSPGIHTIYVRVAWQHTRGLYYSGEAVEDLVEDINGCIDFDPSYVGR